MYIKHDENDNKYEIKVISLNYCQVLKNGKVIEPCDNYEEAQHYIDKIIYQCNTIEKG